MGKSLHFSLHRAWVRSLGTKIPHVMSCGQNIKKKKKIYAETQKLICKHMEGEGQQRDSGQVEEDLKIHAREFSSSVKGDRSTGKKELCSPKQ